MAKASSDAMRRVSVTLPVQDLLLAKRIARARRVSLSVVVAEAVAEGLRVLVAARRSEEVLSSYRQALGGFAGREAMLLNGIVLDIETAGR